MARKAATETVERTDFGKKVDAALRGDAGASLLLTDLDNLMVLNEKAGHEAGDNAIRAATGGDEFALLAVGVPLEQAFLRAEKIRAEMNAALAKAVPRGHTCTATIGVANAPRDAKNAEQLMRKADLALYAAKEQGGNAVGLTPGDDMVLRSSYYSVAQLGRLRALAERQKKKEAVLLREALDDLLRRYERERA